MALLLQGGMALAAEPALRQEVICRKTPSCLLTLMAHLPHAPFPYDGKVGDTDQPFFDRIDAASGQRLHQVGAELAYPESPHYRDNRVLIHLPPRFNPNTPFEIVLFFHGHLTELNRTLVEEMALPEQINATGRNLLLVAPQMVLEGRDSSPGKLYRHRGLDNLLQDVSRVLQGRMGRPFAARFNRAPVILAAFSGGFRATAYTLDRGFARKDQRDKRLRGVILLDALYSDDDKFRAWLRHPRRRGFFINLYGPSSAALSQKLQQEWDHARLPWYDSLTGRPRPTGVYFLSVETRHDWIWMAGPPHWPLVEFLKKFTLPNAPPPTRRATPPRLRK
ncbi:MAG: hypothetical protein HQL99_07415 [Magnetococcales bacterium]|nr:hypothetical protein [Magnetococcales bacterium]